MNILKSLFRRGGERLLQTETQPAPAQSPEPEPPPVQEISPQELKDRLSTGNGLVVVDMRAGWEYQAGHIPGAVHMFIQDIPARFRELPADRTIIFQCWHGNTSLAAAAFLIQHGWPADRVFSLQGGMAGWVQAHGMESLEK